MVHLIPLVALLLVPAAGDPPAPAKEAVPKTEQAPSFPWDLNRQHRYIWIRDRAKVGETTFRILDEAAPTGSTTRRRFRSVSQYWNKTEGKTEDGVHETFYSPSWRPIRYKLRHRMAGTLNMRSLQEQEGEVREGALHFVTVSNNDSSTAVRPDPIPAPPEAYLLLNQSVDNFAIIVADLLKEKVTADREAKILFPDLVRTYQVRFHFEREETVDLGKPDNPKCRLYSFKSSEGQFKGQAWLDDRGRMVQYVQGNLRIYLDD